MNKFSLLALVVSIAALISAWALPGRQGTSAVSKESVYERIMRTGTIRCGYIVYPPNTIRDSNTGGAERNFE